MIDNEMKKFHGILFAVSLACLAFGTSCSDPQKQTAEVAEKPAKPEAPRPWEEQKPEPADPQPKPVETESDPAKQEEEEDERYKDYATGEVLEPHLVVENGPEEIKISGFLKSFRQRDRLEEDLQRIFPDKTITSELKVDTDRHGVGWANRLADPFLEIFISKVKNGRLEYREGIIYMDGVAESQNDVNGLIKLAGTTFIGPLSKDIESNLRVE